MTKFDVKWDFIQRYQVQNVGGAIHDELWIPAEDLEAMNQNIVGKVEVIGEYFS